MQINECINRYLEFVRISKSNGTYRFDRSHAACLLDSFRILKLKRVGDLNRQSMYDLSDLWKKRGVCESTINKRFGLLKRCINHVGMFRKGVSDFPPIAFKEKAFKTVPRADLVLMMQYFIDQPRTGPGLTRFLVFFLLFYTGVRVNELIHFEIMNIDLDACMISLDCTKTGVPRYVFYDQFIDQEMKQYIDLDPERRYLFKDFRFGKEFTIHHVQAILRWACKILQLRRCSPHMFRHTFATLMVENGCPLVALQNLMGHSRPEQTEKYMHFGISYLKRNFDMYKPKFDAPGCPRNDLN